MKYLLVYESGPDVAEKAPANLEGHRARLFEFHDRGVLLLAGPYADLSGALSVFTTREAAEAFAAGDPFVLNGVVGRWYVREWGEFLAPDAGTDTDADAGTERGTDPRP